MKTMTGEMIMSKPKLRKVIIPRGKASSTNAQIKKAVLKVMAMRKAGQIKSTKPAIIKIIGLDTK